MGGDFDLLELRRQFSIGVTELVALEREMRAVVKGEKGTEFCDRLRAATAMLERGCPLDEVAADAELHIGAVLAVSAVLMNHGGGGDVKWATMLNIAAVGLAEWVGAHMADEPVPWSPEGAVMVENEAEKYRAEGIAVAGYQPGRLPIEKPA